jgi:hypothetical protein
VSGSEERDGFVIRSLEDRKEVRFIKCERDGRMRERAEDGLLMKVDLERFFIEDTREGATS